MENCVTLPLLLLQILVFVVTMAALIFDDISKHKAPFDKAKKQWRFKRDYWRFRNDNIVRKSLWGLLGALLAKEIGYPVIEKYMSFPDLADHALNLTLVAVCTFFMPKYIVKEKKSD